MGKKIVSASLVEHRGHPRIPRADMSCGSDAYHSLVQALRRRREELGLSQVDVDEKIGVTRGQCGKWELHERRPRAFLLGCWADALDVELTIR